MSPRSHNQLNLFICNEACITRLMPISFCCHGVSVSLKIDFMHYRTVVADPVPSAPTSANVPKVPVVPKIQMPRLPPVQSATPSEAIQKAMQATLASIALPPQTTSSADEKKEPEAAR